MASFRSIILIKGIFNRLSFFLLKVRAFNDAGFGPYSDVVSTSSDEINPIPRVMLSSQDSIKIIDLDSGESEIIPKSTGIPVDFSTSIEENVVFWANNLEEIFSSRINVSGHYKVHNLLTFIIEHVFQQKSTLVVLHSAYFSN